MKIISEIVILLGPIASAIIAWLLRGKLETRKMNAEADGLELENLHKAQSFWRQMVDDLQREVNQLREQVQKLSKQVFTFTQENSQLKEEVESLKILLDKPKL